MSRSCIKHLTILFFLGVISTAIARDDISMGNDALEKGELQTAVDHFNKALKEKKSFKAYLGLANAHARLDKWSEAANSYRSAIEISSRPSTELLIELARSEYMAEQFENALDTFQKIYADNQDSQTQIWIARCFIRTRQWTRAQDMLLKTLAEKPGDTKALELLAYMFTKSGRADEAIGIHKELVKNHPAEIKYLLALAKAQTTAEQYDNAIDTLEYASRSTIEQSAQAIRLLADLYFSRNMYRQAAGCYQKLIHTSKSPSVEDYFRLGYAYYKTSEFLSASDVFEKIIQMDKSNPKAPLYLGRISAEKGHTQTARKYYLQAIEINKTSSAPLLYLAELEFNNNNYKQAALQFEKAISLGEQSVSVHYNHVLSLMLSEQFDLAKIAIKKAMRKHPTNEKLNNLLGRLSKEAIVGGGHSVQKFDAK